MNTSDAVQAIKNRALALNGQSAVVNLVGGQTLTGTLTYATIAGQWGTTYPDALTVTVTSKAHVVRIDHVSSIGQG
ncbi:hypothetical protein [Streptomyces sparsogenes]|uniref:Uncharacterized protein n=1 Tax=Streptomyces sparsogenes DSM 40356 TaxID=1331668 RepID=A0A1R1STC2_9ACTN|nr:hypothetical protein [Streptomyces sparsogenes]OMI41561.1 hypothetical protein SPAR_00190 [Streptomyces sparsogenes DSM 40356]